LKALAQRNVASAAGNSALEGSDIALVNRDFSEYSLESLSDDAMTAKRMATMNQAGKNAKKIGIIKASGGLIAAAGSVAQGVGAYRDVQAAKTAASVGRAGNATKIGKISTPKARKAG
jgi:hypothetical protein